MRSLLTALSLFLFTSAVLAEVQCNILPPEGGLTVEEIRQIQKIVDEFGHPIVVMGPAADGSRTKGGLIDYYLPVMTSSDFANAMDWGVAKKDLLNHLPFAPIAYSLLPVKPNEMHDRIWFQPGKPHILTRKSERNLPIAPWDSPGIGASDDDE